MNQVKKWGAEEFWGLGFEFDPQWLLTDEQKELQAKLIELARTTLRDNAIESDKMLHACGGAGYKPGPGIERLLRDGKAG